MPDSVEMPAPVKATTLPARAIIPLSSSTLVIDASSIGPGSRASRLGPCRKKLADTLARRQGLGKGSKQRAVYRIVLCIVFCMPLHAESKPWRVADADCLDCAVLGHALDDHPLARFQNALAVEGVHANDLAAEDAGKNAAGDQPDLVAIGEYDGRVGVDFARLGPWHAVVQATRQLANLVVQRPAERNVYLLKAATDPQNWHAARDANLDERQGQCVTAFIVWLVSGMGLGAESGRMNVGAGARQQDAVDHLQEGVDVGEFRRACKDEGHRVGGFYHGAKIALSNLLNGKAVLDAMRVGDHADHGFSHSPNSHLFA